MTLRLADIGARIERVGQLGAVINAMRGIAAARAQQARNQVDAVDSYAATIATAIRRELALIPPPPRADTADQGRQTLVIFAAEQGFAGTFSDRIFASLGDELIGSKIFLVGTRGATVLAERDIVPEWQCAMPSHSAGIPKLADQISAALYCRIAKGEIDKLAVVFSRWETCHSADVQHLGLLPLGLTRAPYPAQANPPLHNLAADDLLAGLTADYLHAQLCHAALHAFAAENEARMAAMAAAREQVERQLGELRAKENMVRQEGITAEVIELAAGTDASQS